MAGSSYRAELDEVLFSIQRILLEEQQRGIELTKDAAPAPSRAASLEASPGGVGSSPLRTVVVRLRIEPRPDPSAPLPAEVTDRVLRALAGAAPSALRQGDRMYRTRAGTLTLELSRRDEAEARTALEELARLAMSSVAGSALPPLRLVAESAAPYGPGGANGRPPPREGPFARAV